MVIAAYSTSFTQRTPYMTVAEFQAAPTGLDLSDLVSQGVYFNQETAVAELLGRASAIMDEYCFGTTGTLCATLNAENTSVTAARDGSYPIHPKFWPILEVTSASVGSSPANLAAVPMSNAHIWIEEQMFTILPGGLGTFTSQGPLQFSSTGAPGSNAFVVFTYVNGWPNTLLSASVSAGASSASVASLTGIYPGQGLIPGTVLNVYDAPYDESLVVSNNYVPGTTPVEFASSFQYPHAAGISVSALPPSIKQACVLVTAALVRERGGGSNIVLSESGGTAESTTQKLYDREGDLGWAAEILDPYRQVTIQY